MVREIKLDNPNSKREIYFLTRENIVEIFTKWVSSADFSKESSKDAVENTDYFIAIIESLYAEPESK